MEIREKALEQYRKRLAYRREYFKRPEVKKRMQEWYMKPENVRARLEKRKIKLETKLAEIKAKLNGHKG